MVDAALAEGGPSFIAARIDDKPGVGTTDGDPVQIRERFMRGLGVRGVAREPRGRRCLSTCSIAFRRRSIRATLARNLDRGLIDVATG